MERQTTGSFSATAKGAGTKILGDALAAVALFQSLQPEARHGVQHAALNLIKRGDESRIPEMVDLLEGYGDKTLVEDYLNCGQPDLDLNLNAVLRVVPRGEKEHVNGQL